MEKETETITNKCPGCGANLAYDAESKELKCSHCGTIKDIEDDNDNVQRRQITDDILKSYGDWQDSSVFRCDSCGAKEVLDKNDITHICPFCGSKNVVSIDELAGIKPDSVIPFQITKESAIERFKKWIKSRWLAPNLFKTEDIRENIHGLYMSSWSFTAQTENTYSGTLGRHVTEHRRGPNGQMTVVTTTRYFPVSGHINESYYDYFVQSGDRIPSVTFNQMKPFDLKLLKVYRQEYLSGIAAEHYSRGLDICLNDFSEYIKADLRRKIMSRHNAHCVQSLNIHTHYKDKKFNYVLLPVYVANYLYNQKKYNFFVNGASGQIVGKYPKSKLKIALIVLGCAVLGLGIAAALYFSGLI